MKKLFILLALAITAFASQAGEPLVTLSNGGTVEVIWQTPSSVRVIKTPDGKGWSKTSYSVNYEPQVVKVKTVDSGSAISYSSDVLTLTMDKQTGVITYSTPKGGELAKETAPATFKTFNDAGTSTYTVAQSFALDSDEDIFGLGILQNGKMSQRGERGRHLCPGNTEDGIPFIQSIKGYGIFWDNNSTTTFTDADGQMTFSSEVGDIVDYYFIYGGNADGVIAQIRELTGDVPMIPMWAYGFFQSKERYKSQDEIVGVLKKYRELGVPIDCMVQDWQYWGNNYLWNAMEFMNEEFPNPQAMVDAIHGDNGHCIISVWQSFGPATKPYRDLDAKGLLFDMETWPQSGISHIWPPRMDYPSGVRVIDAYSPEARDIYWNHLTRLYDLGLDGWWMDSTEPDHHSQKSEDFDHKTSAGTYRSVRLAFPICAVGGVYDHQRAVSDSTRVFILTRSGSFGQQRYGSNVWSGDVYSNWDNLRKQIPAGLNYSLTGNPHYNSDLGGFFAGSYNWVYQGKQAYENPAYRELYTRWMQQGVFYPMMRSHGCETPRELWYYGQAGEPVYDALVGAVKLRYKLLPYIYSTAWDVTKNRGTFMRALAMDFPKDKKAVGLNDEYMFGRELLATPVTEAMYTPEDNRNTAGLENTDFSAVKQHTVYLPAGADWYYFWTNKEYAGGQDVTVDIPLTEAPFFVKAGSILPLGPDVQYAAEKPWDSLEIRVYAGANGEFTLYEDEGDNYNYEKGAYTEIPMKWDDKKRTLTIGKRAGQYPGMIGSRTFNVVLVKADGTTATKQVNYSGKQVKTSF